MVFEPELSETLIVCSSSSSSVSSGSSSSVFSSASCSSSVASGSSSSSSAGATCSVFSSLIIGGLDSSAEIVIKQKVELYPNMCVTNFTESEQWDTVIEGNDDLLEKYMSGKVRHTHIRIQFYLLFDYNFGR